jgi:hypothetical protein
MKYFVQIMAGCGIAAFLVGVMMKIFEAQKMLNAGALGWWRASVVFMALGILYALIEIRDQLRATKA